MQPIWDFQTVLQALGSGATELCFGHQPGTPALFNAQQLLQLSFALSSNRSVSSLELRAGRDAGIVFAVMEVLKHSRLIRKFSLESDIKAMEGDAATVIVTGLSEMLEENSSLEIFEAKCDCDSALLAGIPAAIKRNTSLQSIDILIHDQVGCSCREHLLEIVKALRPSSVRHVRLGLGIFEEISLEVQVKMVTQFIPQLVMALEKVLDYESQLRSFICYFTCFPAYTCCCKYSKDIILLHGASMANAVRRSRLRKLQLFGIENLSEVKEALLSSRRNRIISLSSNGDWLQGFGLTGEEIFTMESRSVSVVNIESFAQQIAQVLDVDPATLSFFDEHLRVRKEFPLANVNRISIRVAEDAEEVAS
mmetsp:Transcript_117500/g.191251  ORF Transcript_117500/g.191251 Transcript_117500/m.191251 type:complete len:365 (-) Transcript_117500:62-1156(-)